MNPWSLSLCETAKERFDGTDDEEAEAELTEFLILLLETLAERIPGSWLIRIRDAGHGLMYQHPDEFNRVLMTFLEDNHEHK